MESSAGHTQDFMNNEIERGAGRNAGILPVFPLLFANARDPSEFENFSYTAQAM